MAERKGANEMIVDKPYFMKDEEWHYHDEKEFKYKLTDKAPEKAVKSYNDFYNTLNEKGDKRAD